LQEIQARVDAAQIGQEAKDDLLAKIAIRVQEMMESQA
jgi:hypothetical protein